MASSVASRRSRPERGVVTLPPTPPQQRNDNKNNKTKAAAAKKKKSSSSIKKYRLGLKRSDDKVIALPIGKFIGRCPKDPTSASDWQIDMSISRENGGEVIPRKLLQVKESTPQSLTLTVCQSRNAPKLIRYRQNNKNKFIDAGTVEILLGPNDELKIHKQYAFKVLPCPDMPMEDSVEDSSSPLAERGARKSEESASPKTDVTTAVSRSAKSKRKSHPPQIDPSPLSRLDSPKIRQPATVTPTEESLAPPDSKKAKTADRKSTQTVILSSKGLDSKPRALEDTTNSKEKERSSRSKETQTRRSNRSAVVSSETRGKQADNLEKRSSRRPSSRSPVHHDEQAASSNGKPDDSSTKSRRRSSRRPVAVDRYSDAPASKEPKPSEKDVIDMTASPAKEGPTLSRRSNRKTIAPNRYSDAAATEPAANKKKAETEDESDDDKAGTASRRSGRARTPAQDSVPAAPKRAVVKSGKAVQFNFETSNFVPPMNKSGRILLPPGVRPFERSINVFNTIQESSLALPRAPPSKPGQVEAVDSPEGDDEDEEESTGPRDMHVSLGNAYWKALNSPQPQLGYQFFQMLMQQHRLPELRLCASLVKLLTFGPDLRKFPYYDGHRLHLAFEYIQGLVTKFPKEMYPRLAQAAGGDHWKTALDQLLTLPYGDNEIASALNLHVFNLKLLELLVQGLLNMDDDALPLLSDMESYGTKEVCRTACQIMAAVWVKYGHFLWEAEHPAGICPLVVDLTNRLGRLVMHLLDHFQVASGDCTDLLWNAMDGQVRASDRKNKAAWSKQLKLYWIPSLEQDEQRDLCIKLARRAGVKEYIAMTGR